MKTRNVFDLIEQIKKEISYYAEMEDDESAHAYEKKLWEISLRAIASGEYADNKKIAELALTSESIEFSRWFA